MHDEFGSESGSGTRRTPRYAAALFDCDGTLLDTIEDLADAGNAVCELNGWPTFSLEEYKHMVGNGQRTLVRRLVPAPLRDDGPTLERAYEQYCAHYARHRLDHTTPYPGILDALDELSRRGVMLGVLTNKNADAARDLIGRFFGSRFAWVQGRVDATPAKPDPTMTRALMAHLGCDAASAIVVGDSDVDVECGNRAGIDSCGVLWGFRDREELEGHGATYVARRPADLVGIIAG